MVRAANTGISAVIDAEGRIRNRLGMRFGNLVLPPLVLMGLLLAWLTDGGAARLWRQA